MSETSGDVLAAHVFFFQAEDGIRDTSVTGVQTCALPILRGRLLRHQPRRRFERRAHQPRGRAADGGRARSEERRVGKEWRSRWTSYHSKKNETSACRYANERTYDAAYAQVCVNRRACQSR